MRVGIVNQILLADAEAFDEVAEAEAVGPRVDTAAVIAASLTLAACGGGGGSTGGLASEPPPVATIPTPTPTTAVTTVQASRFLAQSTMGTTKSEVTSVAASGTDAWLTAQFAMARPTSHWDWLTANGYAAATFINSEAGFDPTMWRQLIASPDQLRQRVGMALLDILVVGISGINLSWKQFAMAAYVDVLLDNAFGTYRQILDALVTNPAMGSFLTFLNNRKANAATGAMPDENFAREVMQLFTLGLYQMEMDGSLKMANGQPIETYTLTDVSQLARVFTGLTLASTDNTTPARMKVPMTMTAANHETGASTFLGINVPAGTEGMAAIKIALDGIYAHPNLPPFVSKQLIQRLVTSNPSAAYVGRVSAAFVNNGAGVRGDMKAVIRAILTDTEARSDGALTATTSGKLREPVMRLTGWARAFKVNSPSSAWAIGDTSSQSTRLGQSMGRSPTVFNFFRPGYTPPSTAFSTLALVAPEFQVTNEQSTVGYVNYMQGLVQNGTGDVKPDYTDMVALAGNSVQLVDEVNLILAGGMLSTGTIGAIRAAVDSVSVNATNGSLNRVYIAILLTLASPDYLTVR